LGHPRSLFVLVLLFLPLLRSTLFPYTTLFRSVLELQQLKDRGAVPRDERAEASIEERGADRLDVGEVEAHALGTLQRLGDPVEADRKSTRLNSSHGSISYAVFCLKKKKPI